VPMNQQPSRRVDTRWFQSTLRECDMSQRELARRLRLDPAAVHRRITGKVPLRLDEVTTIARLLRVTPREVIEHAGVDLDGRNRRH
jgi:transcriptional regulator with XRE-family HTH domain